MLLTIAAILIVLWLIGFIAHIGGGLIHIILFVAIVVGIVHFLQHRKRI